MSLKNRVGSRLLLPLLMVALVWLPCLNLNANDDGTDKVVDRFISHVDSLESVDDSTKAEIKKLIEELNADEFSKMEAITAGLARLYPKYENAIMATQDEDLAKAIAGLTTFVDSEDKFLAADASFFLARTLMNEQRHEEAIKTLEKLTGDLNEYTLHAGPALYFNGVAQASLLQNQRAITSFSEFLENYPNAPERLKVAAWRQIQMIQSIKEGALDDILQRMDFSRRRLEIERTDDSTQEQQDKVVTMLAKMIREQEKKECSKCSSKKNCEGQKESQSKAQGKGQGEGEGQGKGNGGTSNNPNGIVKRTFDNGPASPWSRLRERTRDAANSAVKDRLPSRYRAVVEKYYDSTSGNDGK